MPFLEGQILPLTSISANYVVNNLEKFHFDTITILPPNIKRYMLRKFMSCTYYWKKTDFKKTLKILLIPSLERIDLTLATVDDEMLEILMACRDLRKIDLTRMKNSLVTAQGLINFISTLKHLNSIQISNCDGVNDEVIKCIAANCPNLSTLDISGCTNVSDRGIEKLSDLENIQWLSLSSTQITNDGVSKLVGGASGVNIKELRLANCQNITGAVVNTVIENCPNIEVLVFYSFCPDDHQTMFLPLEEANMKKLKQLTWTVRW